MVRQFTVNQGNCDYPVTFSFPQEYSFVSIDSQTGEVFAQTDDINDAAVYSISISASIEVPIDAFKSNYETQTETVIL